MTMDRRAVLGFALGPVGVGAISFVSLPIMTWIFPPDMIGRLSMLQVAIGLSIVACCMGLDQAYAREYHESPNQQSLFFNATVPGLALLVGILLVFFLYDPTVLSKLLFSIQSATLSAIVAVCLLVAYLSRFLSVILRMQDRGLAYSMSQMFTPLALLLIVLCYALLAPRRTFLMLLLAQAAALVIGLLVFGWSTRRDWWPAIHTQLDRTQLRGLLSFGFPLTFAGIASWGVATLDRVFLRSLSTYDELAVYTVAASVASGVTILASIFNTIWAPMVYKWVAEGSDAPRKVREIAARFPAIMLMLLCLVGGCSWILDYLLPPAYSQVAFLVVGCMVSPMFYTLSEVTGIGIAISRRTVFSLIASGAAVAVNVAACLLLVPRFGSLGAMTATAFSFWLFFALRTEFSARLWASFERKKIHAYAAICLVLAFAYAAFGVEQPLGAVVGWWVLLALVVYVNRTTVQTLFRFALRQFGHGPDASMGHQS